MRILVTTDGGCILDLFRAPDSDFAPRGEAWPRLEALMVQCLRAIKILEAAQTRGLDPATDEEVNGEAHDALVQGLVVDASSVLRNLGMPRRQAEETALRAATACVPAGLTLDTVLREALKGAKS